MNIMVNVDLEFAVLALSNCNCFVSGIRSITYRIKVMLIPGLYQRFTLVITAYAKQGGFVDGRASSAMEHPSLH